MRLIINSVEVDVFPKDISGKYTIAKLLDFSPAATRTEEIDLPLTAKNLAALGNPDVLLNSSVIPFTLLDAQLYVNGIDMQVSKCLIVDCDKVIKVRLFGSNIDFFGLIKDKYLSELDMSALDHTRDHATIVANLTNTTGFCYPAIDYGPIVSDNNEIEVDGMFAAIHAADILTQIVEDAGYTLTGDLITDTDLLTEVIPYCNSKTRYITDADALALYFKAANVYMGTGSTLQTILAGANDRIQFDTQITGSNWDTGTYEFVAPRFGYYIFNVFLTGQSTSGTSACLISAYRKHGADPEEEVWSKGKSFTTTLSTLNANTNVAGQHDGIRLEAGDLLYIKLLAGANNVQFVRNDISMNISLFGMNTLSYYGDEWITALNLPNIKQNEFLKQYVIDYACLISVNDFTKVVTIKKISSIANEIPDDWTDKKDYSSQRVIFLNGFAQVNSMTYLDDENVTKPNGTDKNILISNTALPAQKEFIKSIFGATQTGNYLTDNLTFPRIEITGSNSLKPRRLLREIVTVDIDIVSAEDALSTGVTSMNVPFFSKPTGFDLTYTRIQQYKLDYLISLITTQRIVEMPVMLNEIDISELNYLTPKYIDGVYLLVLEIQFNYSRRNPAKIIGIIL